MSTPEKQNLREAAQLGRLRREVKDFRRSREANSQIPQSAIAPNSLHGAARCATIALRELGKD
jgi:hypothetical protein